MGCGLPILLQTTSNCTFFFASLLQHFLKCVGEGGRRSLTDEETKVCTLFISIRSTVPTDGRDRLRYFVSLPDCPSNKPKLHFSLLSLTIFICSPKVTAIAEMIRGVDVDTSYRSPNAKGRRLTPFSPLETSLAFRATNPFCQPHPSKYPSSAHQFSLNLGLLVKFD